MNREEFIQKLETTDKDIDINKILNTIRQSIDSIKDGNPRGHRHLIITMEELAELSQEVSKQLREKGDHFHILEELADVQLCVYIIQEICNISDDELNKAINVKSDRVSDLVNKGKFQ